MGHNPNKNSERVPKFHLSWLALVFALITGSVQPTIPETPAGLTLSAWLEAFNSGDRGQMDAYYRKYEPDKSADSVMPFRDATGGFDLLEIERGEPLRLEFLVKERHSETKAIGKLEVKDAEPTKVSRFVLRAIPPGSSTSGVNFRIDATTRARVIDTAIAKLNEFYVFPDAAKKMEEAVRARQKRGEYDPVTDGDVFAAMLTEHFQDVSHDKHLRVDFSPVRMPEAPGSGTDGAAQFRKQMEGLNCGFQKVEILSGNVGYLKFNIFADPEVCGPTAIAAMNFLGDVDAIIIDLRENGGGAHPVSGQRIDDHFMIGVPFARAINPISKTNWERVGVEPDVKIPATDALATAQKLATEKLGSNSFRIREASTP